MASSTTLAFFDQLQGESYQTLSNTSFQVGIVDPDDAQLSTSQISQLESSGKTVIGYLSIGEAENFRGYWQSSWNTSPPSFLLGQDPNWPGDYNVKYWDPAWQQIIINQATAMAKAGYGGIMLDVVDAYTVSAVAAADGGIANARADMVKFVEAISAATKAVNPNFKIIQNNALDLLTTNPNDPTSATNTSYLSHIDGVVAESTFYNSNNTPTTWQAWNVQYLEHAVAAGKDVLAIDYPGSSSAQQSFISQAVADGFVPFVGTPDLNSVPSVNSQIPGVLSSSALAAVTNTGSSSTGSSGTGSTGSTGSGTTIGSTGSTAGLATVKVPVSAGSHSYDGSAGHEDYLFYKKTGNTTISHFGGSDVIDIESKIYSTAAQALSHVQYSNGNATLALDSGSSITFTGVASQSLTASDFHIFTSSSDTAAALAPASGTGSGSTTTSSGTVTSNATQGLASYTPAEITQLSTAYHAGGSSDTSTALNAIGSSANSVLNVAPQPVSAIITSGNAAEGGGTANTGVVSAQSSNAYALALGYEVTGNSAFLAQAKNVLLSWAHTNAPVGDPIANAGLIPMVKAYDLIHDQFSASDQASINQWLTNVANAIMTTQSQAAASGSDTAINNHASYALLEVGTIGAVLGNGTFIHYLTDNYLNHIGVNLQSVAGEPPHLGVDYQERDAYHYVAYNMSALGDAAVLMDQLSHLPGNPYGISYNPFTVQVNGASVQNTLDALLPYASGEQQSTHEFQNSTDPNDAIRLADGTLSSVFQPSDAIPALEAADYFGHTVNDPLTGNSYNLAQLAAGILQNEGKLTLPATLPDQAFLQNDITSPYGSSSSSTGGGGTGSTSSTPASSMKVATDSGVHQLDGSAGNVDFVFYKHTGQTTIQHFGAGDTLDIESKIYSSASQALSHVTYSGNNAVLALDSGNSVTLVGVGSHALTASDFHIFS